MTCSPGSTVCCLLLGVHAYAPFTRLHVRLHGALHVVVVHAHTTQAAVLSRTRCVLQAAAGSGPHLCLLPCLYSLVTTSGITPMSHSPHVFSGPSLFHELSAKAAVQLPYVRRRQGPLSNSQGAGKPPSPVTTSSIVLTLSSFPFTVPPLPVTGACRQGCCTVAICPPRRWQGLQLRGCASVPAPCSWWVWARC